MPLEDMLDLGVTGPMLRAAGLAWDTRKDEPYSSYEKFDFEVPDAHRKRRLRALPGARGGDAAERAHREAGARRHAAAAAGPPTRPHVVLPDREKMKTQMEALIYHFKIVTEGFRVPAGEVYQVIESPRGELGYYVVSDGTAQPYRVHMRDAELRQSAGDRRDGRRHADRRYDRLHRQHGFRFGRHGRSRCMTFSPELEARFEKLLKSYPPGRAALGADPHAALRAGRGRLGHRRS